HNFQPARRLGASLVHGLEHAEPVENARGFRREILAADLRARKRGLVEKGHGKAALGQQDGRRRAGGPSADHHDVRRLHDFALTAHWRNSIGWCVTDTSKSPAFSQSATTSGGV